MKIIQLESVSRTFGGENAISDVSLQMEQGDFMVLFGEDDAGKTALLHIIMGFDTAYSGTVRTLGKNPAEWTCEERGMVRFVSDGILLEKGMTGTDYLNMARSASLRFDEKLLEVLCERLEIPVQNPLLAMTYQENKLVQIIAAVCAKPLLLILDEPANFLEKKMYHLLLQLLRMWNRSGMSILLAAEQYADSENLCKSYGYLKEGELVKSGLADEMECRKKAVTIKGQATKGLQGLLGPCIGKKPDRETYLYSGDMERLPRILELAAGGDFFVEELTFEEEFNRDYTRWK